MKNDLTNQAACRSQVIMGAVAIGLGLLFLLDNLDIWDFRRAVAFWPTVLIVIGFVKLWIRARRPATCSAAR